MNPQPNYPEQDMVYTKARYNPFTDSGKGNKVWLESITKEKCSCESQYTCLVEDAPLWLTFYGYLDFCGKFLKNPKFYLQYRVAVQTPYTIPQLMNTRDKNAGFIILSEHFMRGRMPNNQFYIPLELRDKWYPTVFMQEEATEAFATCGPFAPRDNSNFSWDVTAGYRFGFRLGGNALMPKQVCDPCTRNKHELPEPGGGRLVREVQITDPRAVGDSFMFHPWQSRRGFLSKESIKRIMEDSDTDESIYLPSKYPAVFEPPVAGRKLEERCCSTLQQLLQEQQTPTPPKKPRLQEAEEEEEAPQLQLQLHEELQQQRELQHRLKHGIRGLIQEMIKTQRHMSVDPFLL